MVTQNDVMLSEMFQSAPASCLLFTVVPLAVAAMQLANSYVNGLSMIVSVPFAVVMVLFAVLLIQHQFAQFRRQQFERTAS